MSRNELAKFPNHKIGFLFQAYDGKVVKDSVNANVRSAKEVIAGLLVSDDC